MKTNFPSTYTENPQLRTPSFPNIYVSLTLSPVFLPFHRHWLCYQFLSHFLQCFYLSTLTGCVINFCHTFSSVSTFPPSLAVLSIFVCSTDQHRNPRLLCILDTGRHLLHSLEISDLGIIATLPQDLPARDTNRVIVH